MKTKKLFTDQQAIDSNLQAITNAVNELNNKVVPYLLANNLDVNKRNVFDCIEGTMKHAIDNYSSMLRLDIADANLRSKLLEEQMQSVIKQKTEAYKRTLLANIPKFTISNDLLQYIDVIDCEIVIKADTEAQLTEKFTVYANPEAYKKHEKLCLLLNEVFDHPENEYKRLHELFIFDAETRKFEINIEAYI